MLQLFQQLLFHVVFSRVLLYLFIFYQGLLVIFVATQASFIPTLQFYLHNVSIFPSLFLLFFPQQHQLLGLESILAIL